MKVPIPSAAGARNRLTGLRQKTLFRIAAAYAVSAWLVIQVAATVAPAFELSGWFLRMVIMIALVGFVATVGFFVFVRPVDREEMGGEPTSRRLRLVVVAGACALIVAIVGAIAYVARTTLFEQEIALAVLPFADLSPKRDKAYFAEGVAEEILSTLGAEPGIRVLGRTSASQLERNPDPAEVRRTLGVTHLLEGSARTAGDQLRVNVRLIDTGDGSQMWQEEYDGRLTDVFAVQDQIADAVAKRLRVTLTGRGKNRAVGRTSFDSYQSYLAARSLMRERTRRSLSDALPIARKIVASDPGYARAQALFAELIFLLSDDENGYGSIPAEKARAAALPHARMAIKIAPDRPEGYAALGLISRGDAAIVPLKRAIALDPARAELRVWLGVALSELGRSDEAFAHFQSATEIEPLWPVPLNRLVQSLTASGRFAEAEARIYAFRDKGGARAHVLRFLAAIARGRADLSSSIVLGRAAIAADPNVPFAGDWMASEYQLLHLPELAVRSEPNMSQVRRQFIRGQRAALRSIGSEPDALWMMPDFPFILFVLGAGRDWPALAAAYDRRPDRAADPCGGRELLPLFILALKETGRGAEGERLRACMERSVRHELKMSYRGPDNHPGALEMRMASARALGGHGDALDWLERAVRRGWRGQYFSTRLADLPQFDAIEGDPRLVTLQREIDGWAARERTETLRRLGASAATARKTQLE